MEWVFKLAGVVFLGATSSLVVLRFVDRRGDAALARVVANVTTPLEPDVEAWLRPQLRRRTRGAMLGLAWGLALHTLAPAPADDRWSDVPLYWLSTAVAVGAGAILGTLIASYPVGRDPNGTRAASVRPRRLGDYFSGWELLMLRLSLPLALVSFSLAVALRLEVATDLATRALLWSGLGIVVVIVAYTVTRVLISRPLTSATPEGLQWKAALLAHTLRMMPNQAALSAAVSAGAVVLCVWIFLSDASLWLFGYSLVVIAMAGSAVAAVGMSWRIDKRTDRTGAVAATSVGQAHR